jgi:hypothetical protein
MPSLPSWDWPGWTWVIVVIVLLSLVQVGLRLRGEIQRRAADAAVVARQEQVRQTGRSATAVVMRLSDTGTRLGAVSFFVIELSLRVQGDEVIPAFDTTVRVPVSPVRLADFAEGRVIQVRVDTGTREVAVDQRTQ